MVYTHMSNIHKQIPIVKTPSPIVPLVIEMTPEDVHLLLLESYDL